MAFKEKALLAFALVMVIASSGLFSAPNPHVVAADFASHGTNDHLASKTIMKSKQVASEAKKSEHKASDSKK